MNKNKIKNIIISILVGLLVFIGILYYKSLQDKESEKLNAQIMTEEHSRDINALQNELKISKQNAEILQKEIVKIQTDKVEPTVIYQTQYVPGEPIVVTVEKQIEAKDPTLPPEALEKTDKTVVVEHSDSEYADVGVYKINTYRNWELGTGIGVHDSEFYIPISLQRNYSKSHSLELEAHFSPSANKKFNGGEIKWNLHF